MSATNVLPKIVGGLLILLVPGAIGWSTGRSGRGKGIVRVVAGLALLAAIAGVTAVAVGRIAPTGVAAEPENDFASGRAVYSIVGSLFLALAVLIAIVACGAELAQTRHDGRRRWLIALLLTSALPLGLSVTFFTLTLLHVRSSGTYLLGSGISGAFATLGAAAYALFGLAGSGPGRAPVSSEMP